MCIRDRPYANVVLVSLPDSAFVSGTISGEDGLFKLEATSVNQIVKISSIGYKTVYKPVSYTHLKMSMKQVLKAYQG